MSDSDSRLSFRSAPDGHLTVPPECLLFASVAARHDSVRPGAFSAGSPVPVPLPFGGERRASQVPGNPLCAPALLSDTGDPSPPSRFGGLVLPSITGRDVGDLDSIISVLYRTAYALVVYASQWRLPDTTQDSLPAGG